MRVAAAQAEEWSDDADDFQTPPAKQRSRKTAAVDLPAAEENDATRQPETARDERRIARLESISGLFARELWTNLDELADCLEISR